MPILPSAFSGDFAANGIFVAQTGLKRTPGLGRKIGPSQSETLHGTEAGTAQYVVVTEIVALARVNDVGIEDGIKTRPQGGGAGRVSRQRLQCPSRCCRIPSFMCHIRRRTTLRASSICSSAMRETVFPERGGRAIARPPRGRQENKGPINHGRGLCPAPWQKKSSHPGSCTGCGSSSLSVRKRGRMENTSSFLRSMPPKRGSGNAGGSDSAAFFHIAVAILL